MTANGRAALALVLALAASACRDGGPAGPPVIINEVMYHPVGEIGPVDEHEFVEIHNQSEGSVALADWRLGGGIRFRFPEVTLAPGGYLVVAKRREALLAIERYALAPDRVIGDYDGQLENGGERLWIANAHGEIVDQVVYDDRFPWPIGADALGAGEAWLDPEDLGDQPLAEHRFMGRSLERRSGDIAGTLVANWEASPLDGATPGRANTSAGSPAVVVEAVEVADDRRRVRVRFSATGRVSDPEVELYLEDLDRTDEPITRLPLAEAGGGWFQATLPAQRNTAIVRYRVVGDRGRGRERISPRPSDPMSWHSYFVGPDIPGRTPVYQLFIGKENWERLWDYVEQGRVPGHVGTLGGRPGFCTPNPLWNARVPAVLVAGGKVYDIQARYQGSSVNRLNVSRTIPAAAWPMTAVAPARPAPLRPLSWHFNFPRHDRFHGKRAFNLNKLTDGTCLGFSYAVATALFEQAGLPAGAISHYVRLYVNGVYYSYVQRLERIDADLLGRFYGKDHPIGDLFKSDGIRWEQGPYDWGDQRLLSDHCGYSAAERYAWTYKRETPDWKQGSAEIQKMIEDLHAARAGGVSALRTFFESQFDVPAMTTYMAVRNWLAPWDDYFHNHFLYRRTDGRWILIPNDYDGEMWINGLSAPESSFFNGRQNDRSNRNNWFNYLKDAYLRAFRDEVVTRLRELNQTVLHPSNVWSVLDDAAAAYDMAEARQAPANLPQATLPFCATGSDAAPVVARMKEFARQRHERIVDELFD